MFPSLLCLLKEQKLKNKTDVQQLTVWHHSRSNFIIIIIIKFVLALAAWQ